MGIDVGTSGIKVIIIDENGSVLGEGYAEQDVILLGEGYAEQNPLVWKDSCKAAIREALKNKKAIRMLKQLDFPVRCRERFFWIKMIGQFAIALFGWIRGRLVKLVKLGHY